jgi:hypothetical protein
VLPARHRSPRKESRPGCSGTPFSSASDTCSPTTSSTPLQTVAHTTFEDSGLQ